MKALRSHHPPLLRVGLVVALWLVWLLQVEQVEDVMLRAELVEDAMLEAEMVGGVKLQAGLAEDVTLQVFLFLGHHNLLALLVSELDWVVVENELAALFGELVFP